MIKYGSMTDGAILRIFRARTDSDSKPPPKGDGEVDMSAADRGSSNDPIIGKAGTDWLTTTSGTMMPSGTSAWKRVKPPVNADGST